MAKLFINPLGWYVAFVTFNALDFIFNDKTEVVQNLHQLEKLW